MTRQRSSLLTILQVWLQLHDFFARCFSLHSGLCLFTGLIHRKTHTAQVSINQFGKYLHISSNMLECPCCGSKRTMFNGKDLDVLLSDLKKQRRSVKNELRRAPEGSLRITKNGNYLTYLHITHKDGKRTARAIGRDASLIYQLARKEYNLRLLNTLDHNIHVLEKAQKSCLPDDPKTLLTTMPKHFDSLERDKILDRRLISVRDWPSPQRTGVTPREPQLKLTTMEPEEWAAMPYRENTKHLEHKVHPNRRGLLCRSKSEVLVTNEYDELRIYYHYDEVILINGYYLSPDVIGLAWDKTFKYHEHKGLDTQEYRDGNKFKESLYEDAGIVQGRNLIITYDSENGSLNTRLLRELLIDAYLL